MLQHAITFEVWFFFCCWGWDADKVAKPGGGTTGMGVPTGRESHRIAVEAAEGLRDLIKIY